MDAKTKKIHNQIIEEILERFPEFAKSNERKDVSENDESYTYLSYFGDFLLSKIDSKLDQGFVDRVFDYINEVFKRENLDSSVWDLFVIEIFERFDMEEKYVEIANRLLKDKALFAFQKREGRPKE